MREQATAHRERTAELERDVARKRDLIAGLKEKMEVGEASAAHARERVVQLEAQVQTLNGQLERARTGMQARDRKLADVTASLTAARAAAGDVEQTAQERSRLREQLAAAQSRLAAVKEQLARERDKLEQAEARARDAEAEVEAQGKALRSRMAAHTREDETLRHRLEETQKRCIMLEETGMQQEARIAQLLEQNKRLAGDKENRDREREREWERERARRCAEAGCQTQDVSFLPEVAADAPALSVEDGIKAMLNLTDGEFASLLADGRDVFPTQAYPRPTDHHAW